MSVNITGLNALVNELERRLGRNRAQEISDEALKEGAKVFVRELKFQFESFKDKGYSIDEITVSEPMWERGNRMIKVRWRGPHGRYRIIHLNEWGTINNPNPRGKGSIARALRNSEVAYRNAIRDAFERGI